MSFDKLQELANRPIEPWYSELTKKQAGTVQAFGGQLVSSAFNRRHRAKELRELVVNLPSAVLKYTDEQLRQCGGLVPEARDIAIVAAELGIRRDDICKMISVKPQRLRYWIDRGLDGEFPYSTFAQALLQTEAFCDLDARNDAYEAIALELKTSGHYIKMLERIDNMRNVESGLTDNVPDEIVAQFTDEELEEFGRTGKVPSRFKSATGTKGYVDGEVVEETGDLSFIQNYKLEMQLKAAQQEIELLRNRFRDNSEPEVIDAEVV